MHGLIAYSGPDAADAHRAIETLDSTTSAAVSRDQHTVVAVLGSGSTTKLVTTDDGAAAFFGSAAQRCASGPETLLDADPDDVVAVGFAGDGRLVSAAGRGSHRLFAHHTANNGTWVSSSLDALRRVVPGLELDRSYEDFLLGFGFVPEPRSMFQRVDVMKAGTRVVAGDVANVIAISYAANTSTNRDEIIDALHDALIGTIAEQAGDHRRHAVLLGGFDSALVAAVLVGLGHEVETYTFRFSDPTYVQRNVDTLVDHLGIRHHWVDFDSSVIASNLRGFAGTFTQPGSQPH